MKFHEKDIMILFISLGQLIEKLKNDRVLLLKKFVLRTLINFLEYLYFYEEW